MKGTGETSGMKRDEGGGKAVMTKAQPTNGYYCPSRKRGKIYKPRFVRERRLSAKVVRMMINIVNEMCGS